MSYPWQKSIAVVREILSSFLYGSLWLTGKTSVQWRCLLHMTVCYGESEHVVFRPQKNHACIRAAAHMSAFAVIRLKGGDNMSESLSGMLSCVHACMPACCVLCFDVFLVRAYAYRVMP